MGCGGGATGRRDPCGACVHGTAAGGTAAGCLGVPPHPPRPAPARLCVQGRVVPPTPQDLANNAATGAGAVDGDPTTPSGWFGYVEGRQCLYDGDVLGTLSSVTSAEACGRACQAWVPPPGAAAGIAAECSLFNWCPANATANCRCESCGRQGRRRCTQSAAWAAPTPAARHPAAPSPPSPPYSATSEDAGNPWTVSLSPGQCELRYQERADVAVGAPPLLLTKGGGVTAMCGGPLTYEAPTVAGYDANPGSSLFTYGQFNCSRASRCGAGALCWVARRGWAHAWCAAIPPAAPVLPPPLHIPHLAAHPTHPAGTLTTARSSLTWQTPLPTATPWTTAPRCW